MKAPDAPPPDQRDRDRFREEWRANFAVSANAGSGKTTAISERLAEIAVSPAGGAVLEKTAVVTFTRKAAMQIGQRARAVLVRRLRDSGRGDLAPLDHLERAFFGTIHSFCLLLAQRHGQALGMNLNPLVVESAEMEEALWEEFLEQDPMQFAALSPERMAGFLRHMPLESVFPLARELGRAAAERLVAHPPPPRPPEPPEDVLAAILAASSRGKGAESLRRNQDHLREWCRRFREQTSYLPIARPEGTAAGIQEFCDRLFGPLKAWLAEAAGCLAGELALRYRTWRLQRGVQTYADQVESALAILQDEATLDRIRAEGWRIVLDEAQDTDPQQFAVLVEVARPPGSPLGTWPEGGGAAPRAGHFCLVGDGQQAIYGSRADVRNFLRHLAAYERRDGGELLRFDVTFRSPRRLVELLNGTLPAAFGPGRPHNLGVAPVAGAPPPCLQVPYAQLVAPATSPAGMVAMLPIAPAESTNVEPRLASEVRQLAGWLRARGPGAVGARHWGEVAVLAPRNEWLVTVRKELDAAGLKSALQTRRARSGDNPPYAWLAGLLTALCDPEDLFEWVGVLRELFGVADDLLASELRRGPLEWDAPEAHAEPLRAALETMRPLVERVDSEGEPLEQFAQDLVAATGLREKARAVDPAGALELELDRLLAQAAELGLAGGGPREWRRELLRGLETGRPAGQPAHDAINLLTCQSAKGLEWPVVIPVGLWRRISRPPGRGFQLVPDERGRDRAYYDFASLPADMREAREREWQREQVRLLYVTLTRARRALLLPLGEPSDEGSFLDYWGADLSGLPEAAKAGWDLPADSGPARPPAADLLPQTAGEVRPVRRRVLPHQLADARDVVREFRHEPEREDPAPAVSVDPLEYGTWWHETMEFLPWSGGAEEVKDYFAVRLEAAGAQGFGARARQEVGLLLSSEAWRLLRDPAWTILPELSVVAPLEEGAWVDGVIDLVARDRGGSRMLVLDWKTNRPGAGSRPEEMLTLLQGQYARQVEAYRTCLRRFFPSAEIQVALFATAFGRWIAW